VNVKGRHPGKERLGGTYIPLDLAKRETYTCRQSKLNLPTLKCCSYSFEISRYFGKKVSELQWRKFTKHQ
jgi:hypothetical protein